MTNNSIPFEDMAENIAEAVLGNPTISVVFGDGSVELADFKRDLSIETKRVMEKEFFDGKTPWLSFGYTNWEGKYDERIVIPLGLWHGNTEWHPEHQWFLSAWDVEKAAKRDFAISDMGYNDRQKDELNLLRAENEKLKADNEQLRAKLFPFADATEISGTSWAGFNLIGDKKSIGEFHRIKNRSDQIEVYTISYKESLDRARKEFRQAVDTLTKAKDW